MTVFSGLLCLRLECGTEGTSGGVCRRAEAQPGFRMGRSGRAWLSSQQLPQGLWPECSSFTNQGADLFSLLLTHSLVGSSWTLTQQPCVWDNRTSVLDNANVDSNYPITSCLDNSVSSLENRALVAG